MRHRSGTLPELLRQALASARRQKDLSQAQLGKLVGLPQTHVSGIETGRIVPRYDTLLDLVRVLDHDLVLVPRDLVPVVEAVLRERRQSVSGEEEKPLYEPDDDEADQDAEPTNKTGRAKERVS
ncbi:MAG: helix-turn-helix transcriptional regulator [Bryobacterales bacterium]|nr:helix-turn-helix transcriptional regulator [Bryobacterales bacterium]